MATHLHRETVFRDLLLTIDESQVMSHGRYKAFSDVISAGESVRVSKS